MPKQRILLMVCLALSFIFSPTSGAIAQKIKTTDIPVTSRIADFNPETGLGYRIQSDYLYSGIYKNGADSVTSLLQAGGDWELNTKPSPVRRVFVDFGDPAAGGANPPFQSAWVNARFITKSYLLGDRRIRNMSGLNSTLSCPLHISLDYGGNTYRVDMSTLWSSGTDDALVTCAGVVDPNNPNTSQCNRWRITPSGTHDGQLRNLSRLVRVYTAKGKTVEENRGTYYMTFDITVTNP